MTIGVAQRQVIHAHIVTTLHIDVVVLVERRTVDFLLPVGIVMELGIIILRRVVDEELESVRIGILINSRIGTEHF